MVLVPGASGPRGCLWRNERVSPQGTGPQGVWDKVLNDPSGLGNVLQARDQGLRWLGASLQSQPEVQAPCPCPQM